MCELSLPSPPSPFKVTVEKLNKANMYKDKKGERGRSSRAPKNSKDERMDMRNIMKDIELLGHSHMTWKEKKALENKKAVSLGGKLPKQQRLPLSVAKGRMKKQKEREQKILQERMILGCFGGKYGGGSKRSEVKRRPEDQVLKSSEGHFRNGVLDVKHLLHQTLSRESTVAPAPMFNEVKKKGKVKGKKKKGKEGWW